MIMNTKKQQTLHGALLNWLRKGLKNILMATLFLSFRVMVKNLMGV